MEARSVCEADALSAYQEAFPQMRITFKYTPAFPDVTFDPIHGAFYVDKNQAERTLETATESLSRDISFATPWYFTDFKGLTKEIVDRVIEKHWSDIFEEDGTLDMNKQLPLLPNAIKRYKLDELDDDEEFAKRLNDFVHYEGKSGYFDVEGVIRDAIDKCVPQTPHARNLYQNVLNTRIGDTSVKGAIKTVLGDQANDLVERALGWGTTLFTYATDAGLEKEVAHEFIQRTKNVYDSTYGVAKEYFSKGDIPQIAHMKACLAVKNVKSMKRILTSGLPGAECLAQLQSATLYSCENLMQDPPSNNSRASPASPRGGSYSMII